MDVVVDKEGRILVADCDNEKLRKIVGRQVTTLAGGSDAGTADGAGAGARFKKPYAMALEERGRLLVAELGREDTLRVVDASLAPPAWMGPVEAAAAPAAGGRLALVISVLLRLGLMQLVISYLVRFGMAPVELEQHADIAHFIATVFWYFITKH